MSKLTGSMASSQMIEGHGGCPFIRAKKYWPGSASKFVRGLDFFFCSFFDLCSGTPAFFFDDPVLPPLLRDTGVPLVGADAETDVGVAPTGAAISEASFISVSSWVGDDAVGSRCSSVARCLASPLAVAGSTKNRQP